MPDQKSAEDFKVERIDPLVKNTPAVRRHLTTRAWDDTKHRIRFDTMTAYFVWAGSKSGTKSRPIRRLICEEPDEYPPFSSTGGDPLSKAEKRLTTYRDKGRAKILLGGTPTTRTGNIWKRWEMCPVRYHSWVPCPHCNGYQLLQWKQVKWPEAESGEDRARHAERVKSVGLAYYQCEHCKGRIDDHHKPRMLRRGIWANEDQIVTVDGRVVGPERRARRVGVKVAGLYSPWVLFGQLASEWIEAQNDPNALADFVNQRLAEPFEEQRAKTEPTVIAEKAKGAPPPLIVPQWARVLIATADTQGTDEKDGYFWYVIRAWGYDYRSRNYGALASAPTVYVALCTAAPNNASTGATLTEANYTGYARKSTVAADWASAAGASPATLTNTNAINFAACTGGSSTVTHYALVDSATTGAGNMILWGALSSSINVSNGITPSIAAGNINNTAD